MIDMLFQLASRIPKNVWLFFLPTTKLLTPAHVSRWVQNFCHPSFFSTIWHKEQHQPKKLLLTSPCTRDRFLWHLGLHYKFHDLVKTFGEYIPQNSTICRLCMSIICFNRSFHWRPKALLAVDINLLHWPWCCVTFMYSQQAQDV